MKIYSFETLDVWKESITLFKFIYKVTDSFTSEETFKVIKQLRKASVSIGSTLAEGILRKNKKAHFTTKFFSSTMKVLNQLIISKDLNFSIEVNYKIARQKIEKLSNMLNVLRNYQLNESTDTQL